MKYSDMQQQDAFKEYERIEQERNAPVPPPPVIDMAAPLVFYKIATTSTIAPEVSRCGRYAISAAHVHGLPSYLCYRLDKPRSVLLSGCFSSIIDAYKRCELDLKGESK